MRAKGVPRVHAMVLLWNAPSLNLFESMGYEKQSDLVVMGKTLGSNKHSAKTNSQGPKARLQNRDVEYLSKNEARDAE